MSRQDTGPASSEDADDWGFHASTRTEAHDAWSRMLSSTHLPWSIQEITGERDHFDASVRRRHLADLILVDCSCDPSAGVRRAHEISRTDDEYLVMLMTLQGREVVRQDGVESQLEPGSVVIWDSARPAQFAVQERLVKRSLFVPKTALLEVGSRGLLQTGTVLDQTAPAVTLLAGYLEGLSRTIDDLPLGALPAARNATIELLAAALQDVPVGPPGAPAVLRTAAETIIERHLADPALTPALVASSLGVSLRSLHRAYEDTDDSVSGTIRVRRLARARDDLLAGRTVSQVASRWCYSDASHFSRTFKSHFGHNPSDLLHAGASPQPSLSASPSGPP